MAKNTSNAKRRQRPTGDDTILVKSAETVGRAVGTLQRVVGSATERLSNMPAEIIGASKKTMRKASTMVSEPARSRQKSTRKSASSATRSRGASNRPQSSAKKAKRARPRKASRSRR